MIPFTKIVNKKFYNLQSNPFRWLNLRSDYGIWSRPGFSVIDLLEVYF